MAELASSAFTLPELREVVTSGEFGVGLVAVTAHADITRHSAALAVHKEGHEITPPELLYAEHTRGFRPGQTEISIDPLTYSDDYSRRATGITIHSHAPEPTGRTETPSLPDLLRFSEELNSDVPGAIDGVATVQRNAGRLTLLLMRARNLHHMEIDSQLLDQLGGIVQPSPEETLRVMREAHIGHVWLAYDLSGRLTSQPDAINSLYSEF